MEVEDWNQLSHAKIETITEYRLFWWDTLNTTIQIGDHAAMLMMRDTFVSLMLDRLEAFLNIKSDVQVIAFRNDFERAITKLEHAMRDIRVPGPDGNEIAFWETYETSNRSTLMRHESLEVEPWVLNATRAALKQYQEILVSTINVAATIDDCDDMEELLELTGRSFQVVIYWLNPRLMQPSAISGATRQPGWTPDYEARFRIWRIAQLADQVKTFDTLSTTDTYFIFAAGAILSIPVSAVSATAGLILAYAEIGYVIYDSHDQYSRSQAEIEFARGTIEVLGYRRLQRAKAEEYSAIRLAVAIGHTAMFEAVGYSIGRAIPNIFAQFRLARRIAGVRRGRELLRKYNFDPEAVPGNLGARAYREMLDFVADANWLRAASMSMDDDQIKLFRRLEQLEREFLARPRWARSLDDAAHNDLKPYYGRRDIAQLMKRSSGSRVVLAALRYGGRVREEAFKVLQLPHRTAKQFRRALNARLARKTGPFGEDVYDLGSLNNSAAATVVREGHWFFNFRRSSGQNELQIRIYSPDGKVDEDLFRGFNTEKGILFMKAAFRKNVPGRLDVGLAPEIFPKGFPAFLFAQLRYLHEIGVAYAGRVGIALKQVVMKSIVNARTNVQLAWFRKTYYPGKSFQQLVDEGLLDEFLRQTRSVQYAETVINMAGYRIKRVTLDLAGDDVPLKVMAEFYKAGRSGETWKQFLKRYGLRGNDLGPPGFNIKIEVEPDPNAFRNVAASDTPPRPPGGGGGSPPGGRPPDGGPPSGGGTAAAGGAEPEYMQTMAGLRQEVDEIWEKARARVQKGMEDDTDIMPDTAAEFERASERHMTLEAMESAVEEARRAGVPDDVIADHVANFRHFERDANRMSQVNQLNERTLALEGVDTFIPMVDAGEMAILLGRVRAGTTSPEDLRNLRDLFQHAADQGGDFIDDLRRMQVVTPDVSTEPLANAYTLRKLRELAERENLFPTRTAPPESPAPDLPPSVLDQVEQRLAGLDPAEREARRLSAEMLVRMGVPSESAADFAVASTRSLTGSDGGGAVSPLRRAIFLADGIMLHGSRRVDLDEFAQVTGLDSRTVDVGAQAAAVERGLAPLPGEILPARLYPPLGF
ncbi:MAG: hypothetical protein O7G83_05350 [Proteobacteria bacterium]|nr:hypothetical protein [Pseudomonadota bacterium]